MPGICGIISKMPREINDSDLNQMIECMMHESFYTSGRYIIAQLGVYTGWVSHEGSFSDCNPIYNEEKDLVLIFFGENFTDLDLFDQLKAKHHKFDKSNASYLIHLYEEKGIDFLQDLNGWFSGILVDIQTGTAVLFNDRYGMQRIFYYESQDAFYFASEAKSLLKILPELRQLDMKALGEYLCCDCVLENRTLFNNLYLLPNAAAWIFDNSSIPKKTHYFLFEEWENQTLLEKKFFYERLRETFIIVLPRYFRAKQQIGLSLTGGLDTRMIMACMDIPPSKYPCYTFGGMYRDCYDVKIARKVADVCSQTHQVIRLERDFLLDFPYLAEKTIYITDGYLDVSGSPEIYINKLARQIAPIRMTGNYGDEILRGRSNLKAISPRENLFHADFKKYLQNAASTFAILSGGHALSFTVSKEAPWHDYGRLACEQSQLTIRTPYMDNNLVRLMYRAPEDVRESREISLRLIADANPALREIMTDKGVGGKLHFPFNALFRLHREFLFKSEYVYNYGMPQWLAKIDHMLESLHIEKLFLGQHKFYHFRIWYRDELADYVREVLLDNKTLNRPYLNKVFVEEIVHGHTKGSRNYTTEITKLLTVELIQRLLIEQR